MERFLGIDILGAGFVEHGDETACVGVPGDDGLGTDIAGQLHEFGKEGAGKQDGMTGLAAIDRLDDVATILGVKGRTKGLDVTGTEGWHVAQTDEGAVTRGEVGVETGNAGGEGGAHALGVGVVVDKLDGKGGQGGANARGVMAGHDQDGRDGGVDKRGDKVGQQGLSAEVGEELVLGGHARGLPSGEDDGADALLVQGFVARLRAKRRVGEQAANPHLHDLRGPHGQAGTQTLQDPIVAAAAQGTRATGHPKDGTAVQGAEQEEVARVNGHAKVDEGAASGCKGTGHDIGAIDDGRSRQHKEQIAAGLTLHVEGLCDGGGIVRAAQLVEHLGTQALDAHTLGGGGTVEDALGNLGQAGQHQADAMGLKGADSDEFSGREGQNLVELETGDGEGNDLEGGDKLPGTHGGVRCQGGECDIGRLVIQSVNGWLVQRHQAVLCSVEIAAASRRGALCQMGASERLGDLLGGLVLDHVARIQRGDDGMGDPGLLQALDIGGGEDVAFFEDDAGGKTQGVGQDCRLAGGQRSGSKPHAGSRRRVAMTSAKIETAISAGVRAPMDRPTGPWMRSTWEAKRPAARRRLLRAAWVLPLPSAPT